MKSLASLEYKAEQAHNKSILALRKAIDTAEAVYENDGGWDRKRHIENMKAAMALLTGGL